MIYRFTPDPAIPGAIPGVPLRDLDADDLRTLPAHLRVSLAADTRYTLANAAALASLAAELAPSPAPEPDLPAPDPPAKSRRLKAAEEE